jgi:L-lysine exporter family protein LysE/ArgO
MQVAKWGGAAFLFYYGLRSFLAIFKKQSMKIDNSQSRPRLRKTITMCLVFSLLNPHVYLDTIVLLGSISSQFLLEDRPFFAMGAIVASFLWFFSLCYGARVLAPLFRKSITWKVLDFIIGAIMWIIAVSLLIKL